MFGYVVPHKPEMKIREYDIYKSVYCSLCRELEREFGLFAKFVVNYDFVFLYMLRSGLKNDCIELENGRCTVNPLKKQSLVRSNDDMKYAAACLLVLCRYKLSDDKSDEGFFKKILSQIALTALGRPIKKAEKLTGTLGEFIKVKMLQQKSVEKSGCKSLDLASDATAKCLERIFSDISHDKTEHRILSRLGYLVGRFVYIADAADDLADDIKKHRYNPLAESGNTDCEQTVKALKPEFNFIASEIADCYRLLEIKSYKPILDNIIYLGLPNTANRILIKKKGKKQ